ncbi:MAG: hypothetical protein ABSH20_16735 [Tepidisphaeraceae bacterium]
MPEDTAAQELYFGLDLLYGEVDPKMAVQYIKRCIEVADRAFAEDKFRKGRMCMESFPSNRGLAERVRVYARALLGKKFDAMALRAGAEDIITFFKKSDDPIDSQMHAFWLAAVRMTLIAGEPSRAKAMIREAPSLKWHQKEADLLADIAQAAIEAQPIKDRKLLERLDKLFDKVRSPKWRGSSRVFGEPNEQRLELGLIRYRYFTSKDGTIDWKEVIESIRR